MVFVDDIFWGREGAKLYYYVCLDLCEGNVGIISSLFGIFLVLI